ncbi:hypothetical protein GCM10027091_65900 [Streptomyces daliensis]
MPPAAPGLTAGRRYVDDTPLAEKDLTAIDQAVLAGRAAGTNITGYLRVTLSSNLGNVLAMLGAGLLLPFLPMLPAQVLVQNLCFDAAQLAFAFDRPAAESLRHPVRLRPRALLRFLTGFGLLNAAADLATFGVLAFSLGGGEPVGDEAGFHSGWFTENLLTQALVMLLLRTCRPGAGGRAGGRAGARVRVAGPLRLATAGLAVVGLLFPLTPPAAALGLTALPLSYYLLLVPVLALYALALTVARRRYDRRNPVDMVAQTGN